MANPSQLQERVLKVPFQIEPEGSVSYVTSPVVAAAQELRSAVMTFAGERIMRPGVGSPFSMQAFTPLASIDADFITMQMMTALGQQLTRSTVQSINVTAGNGTWNININYTPIAFAAVQSISIAINQ